MIRRSLSDCQFRSASIAETLLLREQSLRTKRAALRWIDSMAEISLAVYGDQATLTYSAIGRTRLALARELIALSQDERFR